MANLLYPFGWNLLIAAAMALAVWLACQTSLLRRRPAVCHGLWLLVLLKLVTPPMVSVPVLPAVAGEAQSDVTPVPSTAQLTSVGCDVTTPIINEPEALESQTTKINALCCPTATAEVTATPSNISVSQSMQSLTWEQIGIALLGMSLFVSCVVGFASACRFFQVRRLLRGSTIGSNRAAELLREVSRRFDLRSAVKLHVVDAPVTPMLWALPSKPTIVLPRELVNSLGNDELRNILAHELGHYVRRDHWTNLFALVVTALFWWNPIAWFARRQLSAAAEVCCDTVAVERLRGSRKSYAKTLLTVVDSLTPTPPLRSALGISFGESHSLRRRFEMIADANVNGRMTRTGWILLAIGCAALTLVPARAQNESVQSISPPVTEKEAGAEESDDKTVALAINAKSSSMQPSSKHPGAEVSLEPDKLEYFLGENVVLNWRIRNTAEKLLKFDFGGDGRTPGAKRAIRFKVEAFDAMGKRAPDPYPNPPNMGGFGGGMSLDAGEDFWDYLQLMRYREITSPGEYTISVYHDLGWEEVDPEETFSRRAASEIPAGPRIAPVATAKVRFLMPSAVQAREVVDAMLTMPSDPGRSFGKRGKPFADFELLRYPVYLPIAKELAQQGDERGLDMIGAMAFPEATAALLELMQHKDPAIAAKAGDLLLMRTPNVYDVPQSRRSYLVERSWTVELKKSAVASAWKLLATDDREDVIRGARIVQSFGNKDDLPALIKVMDRVLVIFKDNAVEQRAYPRPPTASESLAGASKELLRRGAQPPDSTATPGQAVAWLLALGANESFRPVGWRETARDLINHEIPFIRDVALRNLPLGAASVALVAEAIKDDYPPVQAAACELAGKAKLASCGAQLIDVLENTNDDWVMRAAFRAASECNVENDLRLEICVRRMKPRDNDWNMLMLGLLIDGAIESSGYGSSAIEDWTGILPSIQNSWLDFIDLHRQELRKEKRFEVAAPPLTPKMFPPGFRLDRTGQSPWPENSAQ